MCKVCFTDAKEFNNENKSLNWDVSKVKDMKFMFFGAKKFNQDISKLKCKISWKSQPFLYKFCFATKK
ncbi:DUF285 domain-containing protein [Mycoplasmopsis agalactiae]|uniref:DUF285 domain-containing protein n=1 Tax=Mycoplasmopsis agalactiae TaxID=2110 RepID=UPI0027DF3D6A